MSLSCVRIESLTDSYPQRIRMRPSPESPDSRNTSQPLSSRRVVTSKMRGAVEVAG